jgi:hypothetical protein
VQGAQLHHDEEQEDDHGPSRVLEVLQALPQAPAAQGNEVTRQLSVISDQSFFGREYELALFGANKLTTVH